MTDATDLLIVGAVVILAWLGRTHRGPVALFVGGIAPSVAACLSLLVGGLAGDLLRTATIALVVATMFFERAQFFRARRRARRYATFDLVLHESINEVIDALDKIHLGSSEGDIALVEVALADLRDLDAPDVSYQELVAEYAWVLRSHLERRIDRSTSTDVETLDRRMEDLRSRRMILLGLRASSAFSPEVLQEPGEK